MLILTAACGAQLPTSNSISGIPTFGGLESAVPVTGAGAEAPAATLAAVAASAPICPASSTCAAANAEQIPLDCVKKVPYTNVLVSPGTTFEVLDKSGDFTCVESGVLPNGREVITCHGKELYSFQLRLTNPSCKGAALTTESDGCEQGYGYDPAQMCCAPVGDGLAGSTTVMVNLGACPLPNP